MEKRTIKTNWFESVYPPPQIENKSNVSQTYALLQFKISQDKSLMGCDSYSDEVEDCHGTCSNKLLCDLILGSILFLLLDIICSSYCWLLDWNFKLFHLILKNMYVIQRQNKIQTGKVDINLSFLVLLLNWKHSSWYLQWRLPSDLAVSKQLYSWTSRWNQILASCCLKQPTKNFFASQRQWFLFKEA